MNRGVPPTAPNARTGESTPPGITSEARAKRSSDLLTRTMVRGGSVQAELVAFRILHRDPERAALLELVERRPPELDEPRRLLRQSCATGVGVETGCRAHVEM